MLCRLHQMIEDSLILKALLVLADRDEKDFRLAQPTVLELVGALRDKFVCGTAKQKREDSLLLGLLLSET